MNVGELKAALAEFDDSTEVMIQYTYTTNGCGCCNGEESDGEDFISRVYPSFYTDSVYEKGPRGGKAAWRSKSIPCVVIQGES